MMNYDNFKSYIQFGPQKGSKTYNIFKYKYVPKITLRYLKYDPNTLQVASKLLRYPERFLTCGTSFSLLRRCCDGEDPLPCSLLVALANAATDGLPVLR